MFSGTTATFNFPKYFEASLQSKDDILNQFLKEFAHGKTYLPVSIFRCGNICLKGRRKKKYMIIHYENNVQTILKECQNLLKILKPPEEKLFPLEGNTYSSWEIIRKLSTRYIIFLSYVAYQKLPLSKSRSLYKHIIFLNMLNLTKIRFSPE